MNFKHYQFSENKKSCCCLKNDYPADIKEISNPMSFDSVLLSESKTNFGKPKEKILLSKKKIVKQPKLLESSTVQNSTLVSKLMDRSENLTNDLQMEGFYQEITNSDILFTTKPANEMKNVHPKLTSSFDKKKINLLYITNRILVAIEGSLYSNEYDKTLSSLVNYHGDHLKVYHLCIHSTKDEPHKDVTNVLCCLPHLMPLLNEMYNFLTNVICWLLKSKKNVIIFKCGDKSSNLLDIFIRFVIDHDESKDKFLKPESLILSSHEKNAVLFYEKSHLEKFVTPSLKRYVTIASKIFFEIIQYHSNPKHLYVLILKNMESVNKSKNIKKENSKEKSGCLYNDKLQYLFITIYQNFHLIYTSYKIKLNEKKETSKIIYIIDPVLPIAGDILIIANATNRLGLQHIYFRVQFHTCWLSGPFISFKSSELDVLKSSPFKQFDLVELYFKQPTGIYKEHENLLMSEKYFIADQIACGKDIFTQLKLLNHYHKKNILPYKAGPLDGSLYASIPKKSYREIKSSSSSMQCLVHSEAFTEDKKDSSILNKFNVLEKELSNAADLLDTTKKPFQKTMSMDFTKPSLNSDSQKILREKNIKETIDQVKLFSHSEMISNNINKFRLNKEIDEREYKLSFHDVSKRNYIDEPDNEDFPSPYDNFISQKTANTNNNSYLSDGNKINVTDETRTNSFTNSNRREGKYISNLNESGVKINMTGTLKTYLKNEMEIDPYLYDNIPVDESKVVLKASTTQHLWYKSNFTRQNAILYLLNKPIGHFIIRPSISLWKSLSIALKCSVSIVKQVLIDDESESHIRHFIIDINSEGYRIRGFINEKYYKTLPMLVQDHVDNNIGLPCKLILPEDNNDFMDESDRLNSFSCSEKYLSESIKNDFLAIYLGSFILTNLLESSAISFSIDKLQEKISNFPNLYSEISENKMTLKLTEDRIIFTDLKRKYFFRKYCRLSEVICCDVDPKRRVWKNFQYAPKASTISNLPSPIIGIVSFILSNQEFSNQTCCQLFSIINCNSEEFCSTMKHAINNLSK